MGPIQTALNAVKNVIESTNLTWHGSDFRPYVTWEETDLIAGCVALYPISVVPLTHAGGTYTVTVGTYGISLQTASADEDIAYLDMLYSLMEAISTAGTPVEITSRIFSDLGPDPIRCVEAKLAITVQV